MDSKKSIDRGLLFLFRTSPNTKLELPYFFEKQLLSEKTGRNMSLLGERNKFMVYDVDWKNADWKDVEGILQNFPKSHYGFFFVTSVQSGKDFQDFHIFRENAKNSDMFLGSVDRKQEHFIHAEDQSKNIISVIDYFSKLPVRTGAEAWDATSLQMKGSEAKEQSRCLRIALFGRANCKKSLLASMLLYNKLDANYFGDAESAPVHRASSSHQPAAQATWCVANRSDDDELTIFDTMELDDFFGPKSPQDFTEYLKVLQADNCGFDFACYIDDQDISSSVDKKLFKCFAAIFEGQQRVVIFINKTPEWVDAQKEHLHREFPGSLFFQVSIPYDREDPNVAVHVKKRVESAKALKQFFKKSKAGPLMPRWSSDASLVEIEKKARVLHSLMSLKDINFLQNS